MNYERFINERAAGLKPSKIRRFFDLVNEKKDAISLGVGEPDFDTPYIGRDYAARLIQKGVTQYTPNAGYKKLRELISEYYLRRYGLGYDPAREILVTVGASEAIDLAFRATIEYGDEVLIPEPSYVSYAPCVTMAGGVAVGVECRAEDGFVLTAEAIAARITEKTKLLVLPYPNNPTGGVMDRGTLVRIAELCRRHDLLVVSDEIYSELTYTAEGHISIASVEGMKERTIVINGFSKAFAMTGWRLGYLMCPNELLKPIITIHQYSIMCAPTAGQHAAIAVLADSLEQDFAEVEKMRRKYDARRRYVVHRLNGIGLNCVSPQGAFYVYPSVESTGMDGDTFAEKLLQEKNVAVVPGSAFGECGKNHIRISYAYSMKSLVRALDLVEDFVVGLSK